MTSWRGLLERYLHRRDALRVVCHLVDARHGVTSVDKEVAACVLYLHGGWVFLSFQHCIGQNRLIVSFVSICIFLLYV